MSRGLLRDRPALVVGIGASRQSTSQKYGYGDAMQVQMDVGIFRYCGLKDVKTKIFYEVEQEAAIRQRYLIEARRLGHQLLSPGRTRAAKH